MKEVCPLAAVVITHRTALAGRMCLNIGAPTADIEHGACPRALGGRTLSQAPLAAFPGDSVSVHHIALDLDWTAFTVLTVQSSLE
jgi:hypothetical protein